MYKKHISDLDNSESFFNANENFWFFMGNPEYDNYLAWIAQGNEPEVI
jgi:hypothetical protein